MEPTPGQDWTDSHIADIDEQIGLLDQLIASGESTLTVRLDNYRSLHAYARSLLELVRTTTQEKNKAEQFSTLLSSLALSPPKRGRGRPRKYRLSNLLNVGRGVLATPAPAPKRTKTRGAPRKFEADFWPMLNEFVELFLSAAAKRGERLTLKDALGLSIDDISKRMGKSKAEREKAVSKHTRQWYRRLSDYRRGQGLGRYKSKKSPIKSPNFEALERFFPRG